MYVEIQMRTGHLFWAEYRQTSDVIDLNALFDKYWSSTEHEFTVPSELLSPTSESLISDSEV